LPEACALVVAIGIAAAWGLLWSLRAPSISLWMESAERDGSGKGLQVGNGIVNKGAILIGNWKAGSHLSTEAMGLWKRTGGQVARQRNRAAEAAKLLVASGSRRGNPKGEARRLGPQQERSKHNNQPMGAIKWVQWELKSWRQKVQKAEGREPREKPKAMAQQTQKMVREAKPMKAWKAKPIRLRTEARPSARRLTAVGGVGGKWTCQADGIGNNCNTRQKSHVAIHTNNYGDLLFI
jgi:hypothetical protein